MERAMPVQEARGSFKGENYAYGKYSRRWLPIILCAVGAFLYMQFLQNSSSTDSWFVGLALIAGSGLSVVNKVFADTSDPATGDVQWSLPVSARRRFLDKLAVILVNHTAPAIACCAVALLVLPPIGAGLLAAEFTAVSFEKRLLTFLATVTFIVMADATVVLIRACMGSVASFLGGLLLIGGPAIIIGFAIYKTTAVTAALGPYPILTALYYITLTCIAAAGILILAGYVYINRDARCSRGSAAGTPAVEVAFGGVYFILQMMVLKREMALVNLALLFLSFLLLHRLLMRKGAKERTVLRATTVFAVVTAVALAVVVQSYLADRYELQTLHREVIQEADEIDRDAATYRCVLRENPSGLAGLFAFFGAGRKNEVLTVIADGNDGVMNREQAERIVDTLETFCKNHNVPGFFRYAFFGEDCRKVGGKIFGIGVTADDGKNRETVRYNGYYEKGESWEDLVKELEKAGIGLCDN